MLILQLFSHMLSLCGETRKVKKVKLIYLILNYMVSLYSLVSQG